MNWSAIAAILLALAVMLGAFGAHALRSRLDAYSMGIYEKAVLYHFVHALGMLGVSMMPRIGMLGNGAAAAVCALLLAGIVIFSGSLYLLAGTGIRAIAAITPLGGLSFIAAWLVLAYGLLAAQR
ncbi:MAG TPA: DUF423 domain-containing protein [Bryobacteraceae bacterium]|nr:DUF423 domain-containing protein [Bryobacteraceae bacterium]HPU73354.1 DUF423 domain-containing protein [Bryobacteraceae bacterium]